MASKNIVFETVPSSIRVPGRYIEFNTKLAVRSLPVNPQKVLLVAPMLSTGSAEDLEAKQVFSDEEAGRYFGQGSVAHLLARQAIKNNPYIDLTVLGVLDDSSAIKSEGLIMLSGKPSSTGRITVSIGLESYSIAVNMNEDMASIIDRLIDVLNNHEDNVIIASKGADNEIVLTAKNGGTIGNEITIKIAITSRDLQGTVVPMSGGDGNPAIDRALSSVAGKHYNIIISPFNDDNNLLILKNHIDEVSGPIEKKNCIGVIGSKDTLSHSIAKASLLNSGRITIGWYPESDVTNGMIAAAYGAVIAFEEDTARPLNTLEVKNIGITSENKWPLFAEQNNALYNGVTPLTVVNNRVQILRAISTYTKNETGTDDPALLDITTIRTLDYLSMAINQRIALRFPRSKLSNKTPPKVKSELLDVLMLAEELEFVEEVEANKSKLLVERDLQDVNRLNARIPADVVNGLHVFGAVIDLYL